MVARSLPNSTRGSHPGAVSRVAHARRPASPANRSPCVVDPVEHLVGGEPQRRARLDLVPGQRRRHRRRRRGPAASTARPSSWPGCSGSSRRTPCRRAAIFVIRDTTSFGMLRLEPLGDRRARSCDGSVRIVDRRSAALTCMPFDPDVFANGVSPSSASSSRSSRATSQHCAIVGGRAGVEVEHEQVGARLAARAGGDPPLRHVQLERGEVGQPDQGRAVPRRRRSRSCRGSSSSRARAASPCAPSRACRARRSSRRRTARRRRSGYRLTVSGRSARCGSRTGAIRV